MVESVNVRTTEETSRREWCGVHETIEQDALTVIPRWSIGNKENRRWECRCV